MDDGFILWLKNPNIDLFREVLNKLYPSMKFIVEKGKNSYEQNFDKFCTSFKLFIYSYYFTSKLFVRN